MNKFSDLNILPPEIGTSMVGDKMPIGRVLNREIIVHSYEIRPSEHTVECLYLQIEIKGVKYVTWTGSKYLRDMAKKIPKEKFPIETIIEEKDNNSFQFT